MSQKKLLNYGILFFIFGGVMMLLFLICSKKQPMEPEKPCIEDQPVEDTTRVYVRAVVDVDGTILKLDTLELYPKALFVRFYPWVRDTVKIKQLLEKHHLALWSKIYRIDEPINVAVCITDNRRAEYHFTPYGKQGFCNFGADSLVEYAFGVFQYGFRLIDGIIMLKFTEGTPRERIDSLFNANGLRLSHTSIDIVSGGGTLYYTLITPRARKNVLDLGYELNFVPFVIFADVNIGFVWPDRPIRCD